MRGIVNSYIRVSAIPLYTAHSSKHIWLAVWHTRRNRNYPKERTLYACDETHLVNRRCYGVSAPIIVGKTAEGRFQHPNDLGTSAPSFAIEVRTHKQITYMKGQQSLHYWHSCAVKPSQQCPSIIADFFHTLTLSKYRKCMTYYTS